MNVESVRRYCLSLIGVTEDFPFDDDTIVFRIGGKIFACIDLSRPRLAVTKCNPDEAIELRDNYTGIRPAWHWNKHHWIEMYFEQDVSDALIYQLLEKAYNLVRSSLPKKMLYNLPDLPSGWHHTHYPELASTMDNALDSYSETSFQLITTDLQTKGRGQAGNTWESEKGKNLLMSLRFFPTHLLAKEQFLISQVIALSVADALTKYVKQGISIKWPNDIYYKNKKICGILIEHKLSGTHILSCTVGIGININQKNFSETLPNPISLTHILEKEIDRSAVLKTLIQAFEKNYTMSKENAESINMEFHKQLYLLNTPYIYEDKDGRFEGCIKGVDPCGQLVITDTLGKERVYGFKEIAYAIPREWA